MRALLGARLAGTIATQILSVVVGWQVYAISRSPLALGYVGLAQFAPVALLILPAGDCADRFDRRRILGGAWLLEAAVAGLFVALNLFHPGRLLPFFGLLVLFGAGRAFAGPAMQAFVPLLVPEEDLGRAIALNSTAFQVSVIGGPALGGALYILGPGAAYGVAFSLFLGAAFTILSIRSYRRQKRDSARLTTFARFAAGIAYVRRNAVILGAISLDLFAVLFGGATALLPVFASDILHVGPWAWGRCAAPWPSGRSSSASGWDATRSIVARGRSCSPAWRCSASPPLFSACRGISRCRCAPWPSPAAPTWSACTCAPRWCRSPLPTRCGGG